MMNYSPAQELSVDEAMIKQGEGEKDAQKAH